MTPERLRQIEELYHSAREREAGERTAFLAEACLEDEDLRREVESLLASDASSSALLEAPMREAAAILASQQSQSQHQLALGLELGPYVIEARLGAGGMGEVYRAKDKRLRRTVALKVLPPHLAGTPGPRQRLEREAEAISSLNHPHICTLYDIGRQDEIDYLVMEFLEGETLAQRLKRGALALPEVLEFVIQITSALDAAHSKGIIHRDLKPANIFVVGRGQVKVLDFGLAKLKEPALGSQAETGTMEKSLTNAGLIVGTVAYMSPEQARGDEVDTRTDLFSLGGVLYEMATGTAPFRGNSTTLILDAILHATPVPPRQLRPELPTALDQIICTALEKDRELRYQTASELRAALMRLKRDTQAGAAPTAEAAANATAGVTSSQMTRRTAISAVTGVAAGAAGGVFGVSRWRGAMPRNLTRFTIPLPEGGVAEASLNKRVAISPDGTHVAYTISVAGQGQNPTQQKFYLRSLSELEPKLLPLAGGVPFFSPDGRWLGFFSGAPGNLQIRKIGLGGGAPVTVCTVEAPAGFTWAADDTIYFVGMVPGGVMRVPAAGGPPAEIAKIDFGRGERMHKYPCAIPGGKAVLFTVTTPDAETFDDGRIAVVKVATGQRKTLVEGGTHPRYSPSGHLVYARAGNLLAIRFDPKRLEVTGQPFTVLEGVVTSRNSGVANFDISSSGDLVYVPGVADKGERTLVWVDRNGKTEPLPLPQRSYLHPRISPDSRQLAVEIEGPNHDFYVYDFARAVLSKMTTDGVSHWPVWSPDGAKLVYRSGPMMAGRMWQIPADRSRSPEQLPGTGLSQNAESWSPDGHAIAYTALTPEAGSHIMVESLEGDHPSHPFADTMASAGSPKFSPDGHWLAYCSNESGKAQAYVQAFPGPGPKIQVSNDGGTDPVWKKNGGELYFRDGDKMMAVSVSTARTFTAGRPQMLWEGHYSHGMSTSCGPPGATSSNYDVTADGRRFLMVKDEAPDTAFSRQIVVVLGWADEVARIERSKGTQS